MYKPQDFEVRREAKQLKIAKDSSLFKRFCNAFRGRSKWGQRLFIKNINNKIDSFLLVTDLEGMISNMLRKVTNETDLAQCDPDLASLDISAVREWLMIKAPVAFKKTQGLICSDR